MDETKTSIRRGRTAQNEHYTNKEATGMNYEWDGKEQSKYIWDGKGMKAICKNCGEDYGIHKGMKLECPKKPDR